MAVQKKLHTVDEFEAFITALSADDARYFELIDGEIVGKAMPTQEHGIISVNVSGFIWNHNRQRKSGRIGSEVRHRVPGDQHNARQPDLAYYIDAITPVVKKGAVPRMPDLAIEIKSPDDTYTELRRKAEYYLANGARLVWLIYPEKRLVEVYQPDVDLQILTEHDTLDGGDVLPGFSLLVSDIFEV